MTRPGSPTTAGSKRSPRNGLALTMHRFYRLRAERRQRLSTTEGYPTAAASGYREAMGEMRHDVLAAHYRALLLDCDGVLYLGDQVIQEAPAALAAARAAGCGIAFITNNSRTSPAAVAAKLAAMGIQADPAEVFTSAQAVVRLLGGRE